MSEHLAKQPKTIRMTITEVAVARRLTYHQARALVLKGVLGEAVFEVRGKQRRLLLEITLPAESPADVTAPVRPRHADAPVTAGDAGVH